jgi:hypothetical protein
MKTCPKCTTSFTWPSTKCPVCGCSLTSKAAESGDTGVYGWLLILCIWLTIIGPFLSFATLHELPESQIGLGALLILSSIVAGILLWSGRYIGYRTAMVFFWAMICLSCLALVTAPSDATITQALATVTTSALWLAYLGCSRRVANTYFRNGFRSPPLRRASTDAPKSDLDADRRQLAKLRDDGILTEEEFAAKKRQILRL